QFIYPLFISIRRSILDKRIDLGGGGRETGQIKSHPSKQSYLVGLGRLIQSLTLEARQDKVIDRVARPGGRSNLGWLEAFGRKIGPVCFPFGALIYPAPQQLYLLGAQ